MKLYIYLAALAAFFISSASFAACPTTSISVKDGAGATQVLCYGGASGSFLNQTMLTDASNAAITNTNGLYSNILQGNAVLSSSNGIFVAPITGANFAGAAPMQSSGGTVGIVAGSAIIGNIRVDQTTPGTTNAISIANIGANAVLAGAGAVGTGSQRIAVGQDTTTLAGSAPGTAGTPSANIVSIQGASSMTPVLVTPSAPADPCYASAKSQASFSSTTSGGSIVTAVSAKKIYVCQVSLLTSAIANVSFIEGTGSSVCTSGSPAGDWLNTGVTASNGAPFAANAGISAGSSNGTVFSTQTTNTNLCVLFTTTNTPTVVASVSYVQQ